MIEEILMKNKMKRIEKLIAVSAVVLALVGCGQAQNFASSKNRTETSLSTDSESAAVSSPSEVQSSVLSEAETANASVNSSSAPVVTTEKPQINASDLWKKYDKDPDKHTPTYDGKKETATGVITYIGKDDHGTDSLQISDTKGNTSYVLGVFRSADEMSAVSVGDTVTITGNFHIMSSKNMVVLKGCRILKIYQ